MLKQTDRKLIIKKYFANTLLYLSELITSHNELENTKNEDLISLYLASIKKWLHVMSEINH